MYDRCDACWHRVLRFGIFLLSLGMHLLDNWLLGIMFFVIVDDFNKFLFSLLVFGYFLSY
jgi:hypothetical protein